MNRSNHKAAVGTPARLEKLAAALIEAGGNPVHGRRLAEIAGIEMGQLTNVIYKLAKERPDLQIGSIRPHGYRAAALGPVTIKLGRASETRAAPAKLESYNKRFRRGMDLVELLDQPAATAVAEIALESEELFAATVHRLLSYGIREHRARVAAGEHPLHLRQVNLGRAA